MAKKRPTGGPGNRPPPAAGISKEELALWAKTYLAPSVGGASLAVRFGPYPEATKDLEAYGNELAEQCRRVRNGDLSRAESMLMAQAHSLDAMFTNLALRAGLNMGEYIQAAETYMKLALRAQSQCRATLETLATIKNPPVVIAKQANIANGPQQVNNGVSTSPRAGNSESTPTEESGGQRELLQDARAPAAAFGNDPPLAAVGEVHRAEDAGG